MTIASQIFGSVTMDGNPMPVGSLTDPISLKSLPTTISIQFTKV
jgi:hypothetical protein